ncbi:DUF6442 family protein [Paenibacillus sanguinis]|uniref:DUF6442 family protein n=1 Tax=Paenibacillus sanguinis TaxID=225906 RepID=UPI00037E9C72|nr:DUF6442 family protein [Paenibacillus sanguinis]
MQKNNLPKRPFKDERDQQIEVASKSYALELMITATQILTLICLVKGNPAWKGSLALLFIGGATGLFYKHKEYNEKAYFHIALIIGLIGIALLIWFCFSGS